MMPWIGLRKFADVNFGITQKPLYIASSNLVRKYVTNKETFLNLFISLKSDKPLVSDFFVFNNFIHQK